MDDDGNKLKGHDKVLVLVDSVYYIYMLQILLMNTFCLSKEEVVVIDGTKNEEKR